jgi:hypothetical protein
MFSLQRKLAQAEAFFERENARDDAIARSRPAWWNVGKLLLGLFCIVRSFAIATSTTRVNAYALAALFFIAGAYLAYEGARLLIAKRRDPPSPA